MSPKYLSVCTDNTNSPGLAVGFDIEKNTFAPYGSPSQKVTFTSLPDIGKAVAQLSILAIDPSTSAKVPNELRIAGSTHSTEEIRDIVARVKGVEKGQIVSEDLAAKKDGLKELRNSPGAILSYLRSVSICVRCHKPGADDRPVQRAHRRGKA